MLFKVLWCFLVVNLVNTQRLDHIVVRGFEESCTEGIRLIRASFGEWSIKWDQNLANQAEERARHFAIGHNAGNLDNIGENYFSTGYIRSTIGNYLRCSEPLWGWYQNIYEMEKGHISQLVGERVTKFGVGVAYNGNQIYFVARFDANIGGDTWWYHNKNKDGKYLIKRDCSSLMGN